VSDAERIIEQVIREFPFCDYELPDADRTAASRDVQWPARLAEAIGAALSEPGITPQEPTVRAVEGRTGPEAIQWTGDNLQAVQGFLGDAYDKLRGGIQPRDPYMLWFWTKSRTAADGPTGQTYDFVKPGEWIERYEHSRDGVAFRKRVR
jgi:hypothetical protein